MIIVHLTTYNYQTLVVVPKNDDSAYKNRLNEYVKETMTQSNAMKLTNFRKHYKTYAEAFKQNIADKLEPNQMKETKRGKKGESIMENKTLNDLLMKMMVLTMQQIAKTLEVMQEVLVTVYTVKNRDKKEEKMKQYKEKIKLNKEQAIE